jgi:hypothetical protein
VLVVVAAVLVRLLLIYLSRGGGGADLNNHYYYYSAQALAGHEPYSVSPATSTSSPLNNPPPMVLLFTSLLAIKDSPITLRLFFAGVDVAVLLTLLGLTIPRQWKLPLMAFYAFNPWVLYQWVETSEDKPIMLLLVLLTVLVLERGRSGLAVLTAGLLTAYRIVGAVFLPPLILHHWGRRGARVAMWSLTGLAGLMALSVVPWFPDSLRAYSLRADGTNSAHPTYASLAIVLDKIRLYRPGMVPVFILASLAVIAAVYVARMIDIREAVVLSLFFSFIAAPDFPVDRSILITLAFLPLIAWSRARLAGIWMLSCVAALASLIAIHGVPGGVPGGTLLAAVFGREGSVAHALWTALFPFAMLGFYLLDKRRGRVTHPELLYGGVGRRFGYSIAGRDRGLVGREG